MNAGTFGASFAPGDQMTRRFLSVLPAAVLAMTSLTAIAAIKLTPSQGQPVAALFAPHLDADDAFQRVIVAGGTVLRRGGVPSLFIARSDAPDFVSALYKMGAVLVADANGARGCPEERIGVSQ